MYIDEFGLGEEEDSSETDGSETDNVETDNVETDNVETINSILHRFLGSAKKKLPHCAAEIREFERAVSAELSEYDIFRELLRHSKYGEILLHFIEFTANQPPKNKLKLRRLSL